MLPVKDRLVGEIGAVFERFILQPDLNPLGAENETGREADELGSEESRCRALLFADFNFGRFNDVTF